MTAELVPLLVYRCIKKTRLAPVFSRLNRVFIKKKILITNLSWWFYQNEAATNRQVSSLLKSLYHYKKTCSNSWWARVYIKWLLCGLLQATFSDHNHYILLFFPDVLCKIASYDLYNFHNPFCLWFTDVSWGFWWLCGKVAWFTMVSYSRRSSQISWWYVSVVF